MNAVDEFDYHRSVAPMMWVLVAIASVELLVTHFLVALLVVGTVALVLSTLTLASVIWLVTVIASMRRLPVLLDDRTLTMRAGSLKQVVVPLSSVAGLRETWDAATVKDRAVRNLALISYPNVVVDLKAPLADRRGTSAIAHRLDDPDGFARALTARLTRTPASG